MLDRSGVDGRVADAEQRESAAEPLEQRAAGAVSVVEPEVRQAAARDAARRVDVEVFRRRLWSSP
jgi:hypothetical protein